MRLWIGIGIFIICFLIGWSKYRSSLYRVNFYQGLIAFCNNLNTEIAFALMPIAQIIDRYKNSYSIEFNQALNKYAKLLKNKKDITYEKCLDISSEPQVADFFYNLGRAGSQEEKDKIKSAMLNFRESKKEADNYLKTKASIMFKVLIIIGIAGVIFWI